MISAIVISGVKTYRGVKHFMMCSYRKIICLTFISCCLILFEHNSASVNLFLCMPPSGTAVFPSVLGLWSEWNSFCSCNIPAKWTSPYSSLIHPEVFNISDKASRFIVMLFVRLLQTLEKQTLIYFGKSEHAVKKKQFALMCLEWSSLRMV